MPTIGLLFQSSTSTGCSDMPTIGLLFQSSTSTDVATCLPLDCCFSHLPVQMERHAYHWTVVSVIYQYRWSDMPTIGLLFQSSTSTDGATCLPLDCCFSHLPVQMERHAYHWTVVSVIYQYRWSDMPTLELLCQSSTSTDGATCLPLDCCFSHLPVQMERHAYQWTVVSVIYQYRWNGMPTIGLLFQSSTSTDGATCLPLDCCFSHLPVQMERHAYPWTVVSVIYQYRWSNMPTTGLLFQSSTSTDGTTCLPLDCCFSHLPVQMERHAYHWTVVSVIYQYRWSDMPTIGLLFQSSTSTDVATCLPLGCCFSHLPVQMERHAYHWALFQSSTSTDGATCLPLGCCFSHLPVQMERHAYHWTVVSVIYQYRWSDMPTIGLLFQSSTSTDVATCLPLDCCFSHLPVQMERHAYHWAAVSVIYQ